MDTTLNLSSPTAMAATPVPVTDQAITRKVTPVDARNTQTTRPAEKPFVAQVVSARLSGTDFPQNPGEIAPADRTLRPYDVPMLPSREADELSAADTNAETAILPDPLNTADPV